MRDIHLRLLKHVLQNYALDRMNDDSGREALRAHFP